jgi:hypothetical protein
MYIESDPQILALIKEIRAAREAIEVLKWYAEANSEVIDDSGQRAREVLRLYAEAIKGES